MFKRQFLSGRFRGFKSTWEKVLEARHGRVAQQLYLFKSVGTRKSITSITEGAKKAGRDHCANSLRSYGIRLLHHSSDQSQEQTPLESLKPPSGPIILSSQAHTLPTSDSLLLRDSCACPLCLDVSTKQKLFQTADIPSTISGHVNREDDTISWTNDIHNFPSNHRTPLTATLKRATPPTADTHGSFVDAQQVPPAGRIPWDKKVMADAVRWLPFTKYVSDDDTLFEAVESLRIYGLVFVRGVPDDERAVERVAERIGTLRDTFYGRTWDVRSVKDAKNIAYTHQFLGLHMDLL